MKLKITSEKQNPLFNRKEVEGIVEADSIPKKQEVAEEIAKKYKVPSDALRILHVKGKFGSREFELKANVYDSKKERDELEIMSKKESEAEAPKASEEKPAEEKPVEAAPAEEKKSEEKTPAEPAKSPAEEAIGMNPVEEAKKAEAEKAEEGKKEKDKTEEEKQSEK